MSSRTDRAGRRRRQLDEPGAEPADRRDRSCAPTNPRWRRCPSPGGYRSAPPCARRAPGPGGRGTGEPPDPSGGSRRGRTILAGGATRESRGSCCPRGSSYCPRAAVRRLAALGHSVTGLLGIAPTVTRSSVGTALTSLPALLRPGGIVAAVRIGFVGAGLMGSGMIRNLAAAGHEVALYARSPSRARDLPARLAGSVAEAADGADLACSCVTDSDDVREVVAGLLAAPAPPPVLVEMSTIAPAVARELAADCAAPRRRLPRLPGERRARRARRRGRWRSCAAATPRPSRRAAPALDAMGDPARRTHCGPVGLGPRRQAGRQPARGRRSPPRTAEALGAGQRAGLDPALAREVADGRHGRLVAAAQPLPARPRGRPRAPASRPATC